MPQFFDPTTGQPLPDLAPDEAAAAITQGKAGLDKTSGPVLLKGKDGSVYKFAPEKVPDVLAKYPDAYQFLTPQEELQHRVHKEEEAKGLTGSLEEGASSFANQALFGVPEAIASAELSPKEAAEREARQQEHSTARLVGGAAGVGATMLAGGELFKAADLAGQAVARGVLPAAAAADASLGARLAGQALNYATQGAIFSSPQALVQATIGQDPKKAAETLAWGIGLGGLLGGGGELLSSGVGAAKTAIDEALVKNAKDLDTFANTSAVRAAGAQKSQLMRESEDRIQEVGNYLHENELIKPGMSRQDIGDVVESARKIEGGRMGDAIGKLDSYLEKHANEPAMPRFDDQGFYSGERVIDNAIKPGDIGHAIKNGVDLKPREIEALTPEQIEQGLKFGTYTRTADGGLHMNGMWGPDLEMPMNADRAKAIQQVIDSADKIETHSYGGEDLVSFEKAQDFASLLRRKWGRSIDNSLNEGGAKGMRAVTPLDDAKADAYFLVRHVLHSAADDVALAAKDPSLVGELGAAKKNYATLAQLETFAQNLDRQQAGNKGMFGLTDTIHAGRGIAGLGLGGIGAAVGGLMGGAPGAVAGGYIGKLVGSPLDIMMKHWMEDKGLVIMSALAKRAAKEGPEVWGSVISKDAQARLAETMGTVKDTLKKMAIEGIQQTSQRTNEHMKHLLGSTSGLTGDQAYNKLGDRLNAIASNPQSLVTATSAMAAPFAQASPALGAAYQAQVASAITYLHNAFPRAPMAPMPFAPVTWSPSPTEKLAFHDKAEVVANPMSVMKHVAAGTLSDAHLEALTTQYPQIKDEMTRSILETAALYPDMKLSPAAQAGVSKLLGLPLDPLMQPQAVQALQAQFKKQSAPQVQAPPKGKIKNRPSAASAFSATTGPGGIGEST
jgi:hypothetical protein